LSTGAAKALTSERNNMPTIKKARSSIVIAGTLLERPMGPTQSQAVDAATAVQLR
jgi:hypothetical protein